jgi:acetyl-CoA carboxylase beta subunit
VGDFLNLLPDAWGQTHIAHPMMILDEGNNKADDGLDFVSSRTNSLLCAEQVMTGTMQGMLVVAAARVHELAPVMGNVGVVEGEEITQRVLPSRDA